MHNLPVCVDARMLGADTGVATYARGLRAALRLIAADRLLLDDGTAGAPPRPASRRERIGRLAGAIATGARHAYLAAPAAADGERLLVATDLFRRAQVHFDVYRRLTTVHVPGPAGIMHWTYPVPLRIAGWSNLYTVHDAIPLRHPELTPIDPLRHRRLLDRIAAQAAALVTVSASARRDIVAALGCDAAFVVDCSQAVDDTAPAASARLPGRVERGRYLLVCGSVEPRKNIARILAAHAASGAALPLVIAGPDGWRADEFAEALRVAPRVVRLAGLARADILALVAGARALLMPSLAEGFGLPVVEAMALGTPVLTAATGALAETAGGAALTVDPLDVAAIATGMTRLADDDGLCAALAEAGRRRARAFTLPAFAARLAALHARLIAPQG